MADTYLAEDEVAAIQSLPRTTPYMIRDVSTSMFSVARHYGGCKYNGANYVYMPATDELVRDDVVKLVGRRRKRTMKRKPAAKRP